jgi:hypothetical protein
MLEKDLAGGAETTPKRTTQIQAGRLGKRSRLAPAMAPKSTCLGVSLCPRLAVDHRARICFTPSSQAELEPSKLYQFLSDSGSVPDVHQSTRVNGGRCRRRKSMGTISPHGIPFAVADYPFTWSAREIIMKKLLALAITLCTIYAGLELSRRRSQKSRRRSDLDQWEGEGGAVPVDDERTAAQTHAPTAHQS